MEIIETIKDILDMTVIDESRYVAPEEQTVWIQVSSLFFLVPSIYGYNNGEYEMSIVLYVLSITSYNFWRKANYSWRRIVDRIYAKIAFIICIVNGVKNYKNEVLCNTSCIAFVVFVYMYYMSNKYCNDKTCNEKEINPIWWKYHMMFHLLATYVQIMVIRSMIGGRDGCMNSERSEE